jgi:hypothetical protein
VSATKVATAEAVATAETAEVAAAEAVATAEVAAAEAATPSESRRTRYHDCQEDNCCGTNSAVHDGNSTRVEHDLSGQTQLTTHCRLQVDTT